jgi:hypothetical protein
MGPGYLEEGKALDLTVENEPFNYALIQGNFRGQVFQCRDSQKALLLDRSNPSGEATYFQIPSFLTAPHLRVERQGGVLSELSLFSIRPLPSSPAEKNKSAMAAPGPGFPPPDKLSYRLLPSSAALNLQGVSRGQIASLYNLSPKLLGRFLPPDRETWVGAPAEIYKPSEKPSKSVERLRYSHIVLPPFLSNTGLDAVKLKLNPEGKKCSEEAIVHVSARDPVDPLRDVIDLSLRLPAAGPAEILLDVRDLVVPAGTPLWLVLASDQKDFGLRYLNGAEVEVWMTETGRTERAERARKEYFSDRLRWVRDSFQGLSHSRPWLSGDVSKIRRQFKLVDELYRLIEDVLRVDPKEPTATAYLGWINPNESPPDFKQPEPSAPDIPRWVFQQEVLVKQFEEVVDWWIKNRQIKTGEMGGGLRSDTGLISNWPGIALMEGPTDRWRDSVRTVLEACYRRGWVTQGLNTRPADALQAYEEGINTVPTALLLDYGNPLLIERLMETARQYERLTGINTAGHRHFRSYFFGATDLVEEGRDAREDIYSQLLWHSGLYLSWYNGNPQTIRWLSEYADALLAHWQKDRYPSLTRGIRFGSDDVISKGLPNPEVTNLLWGVYRLTGNDKYLWLTDKLLKGGNVAQAEMTNGRWLDFVDPESYRGPILDEVRKRNIWDHNLQSDEAGLLARQHDYELTGDKKQIEDYQAALIKHMAQNMLLYTSAEQSTDSIWIPQRATQRARLGGVAHYRNCIYPGNAVSWEGTGGNVAALVTKATAAALKIVVFNSAKTLQDVNLRVWELENGTYEVVEGTDVNGDDQIDVVTRSRTLPLKRHTAIPLALRPRRTTIVDIKQLRKGTPLGELPDLAIGPEDLQYDTALDKGKIIVHNIGGKKSPPFTLVVENENRTVLFKKELGGLEAPTDLKPKTLTVELSGLRAHGARSLIFKLDPVNKVEEITDENNQLRKNL